LEIKKYFRHQQRKVDATPATFPWFVYGAKFGNNVHFLCSSGVCKINGVALAAPALARQHWLMKHYHVKTIKSW
jgi:hypothetical protein